MPPPPPAQPLYHSASVRPCPNTSVGISENEEFSTHGSRGPSRSNEDRYYNGWLNGVQLCMVLDGHDGEAAADFACNHLSSYLLHGIRQDSSDEEVKRAMQKAFRDTETQFFVKIDDAVIRKQTLMEEISQRAPTSYQAQQLFPNQVAEIGRLAQQISGGTTVVLSLIHNDQLFVANVGDSRAVLCYLDKNGELQAEQISDVHNVYNPNEQQRLSRLGMSIDHLVRFGRLGPYQVTRSIGDHAIKGGYKDVDILSHAISEPGTADPFINGPWRASAFKGFLLLMSDGLYESYGKYIGTTKPQEIHRGLSRIAAKEMKHQVSLEMVAQAVVNQVKSLYKERVPQGKLDDITLIIYDFGYCQLSQPSTQRMSSLHSQYSQPPAQPYHRYPVVQQDSGGGYFSPEDPTNYSQAAGGYPQPAGYPGSRQPYLNTGHGGSGMMASASDTRLDQYGRDNSHYPSSNAGLGVDRQPALPMQRVSSGPINASGNEVVDGMAGLQISSGDSRQSQPRPRSQDHSRQERPTQPPPAADVDDSTCIDSYVEFPDFPHNLGIEDF